MQKEIPMLPFVILLFVPIIIQHIGIKGINYKKKNNFALFFFFTLLTVLVMFRHESIGNDTENYIYYFENISKFDWSKLLNYSIEIGYVILNKLVSVFSDDYRVYLAVAAILVSVMIYPTYKRLCIDSSLTIVLFCTMSIFVMMFSGIRQMLAIGIGFIAYECTRNKKLVSFAIAVALAITFHTSAFMLAFMYPLYHAKITKKWLITVVPTLAVVFVFNRPIFSFLSVFIEQYTKYESDISSTGAYSMLILFVIFTVFAFIIPDNLLLDRETIGLRNFLLLALVVQMFAPLHMLAMRMNYYYIIFIPLLLPKIISYRSKKWEQVAIWGRHIMVVFFLAYFFVTASSGGGLNVFPYHFFWENI